MNISKIKELADKLYPEVVTVRRYLHKNPELSYQEHQTTEYIVQKLKALGISVDRPLETGCIGVVEGSKSSNRVTALRADIDALPIAETGAFKEDFISQNEGVAHCCGHDVHTANMLGVARILVELKNEIEGKVLLIFQPGEETLPGGGRLLCETNYLQEQGVDHIYGLHTYPDGAPGTIAVRKGPLMARPDEFDITIKGEGGHASTPHVTVDPIVLAGQIITQFQTIVSRSVDPTDDAVLTIGKVEGGSAHNIIPETVDMLGTVRTFSEENAYLIRDRMEAIVESITKGAGGDYDFAFNEGYPAVWNDVETTENVIGHASQILGNENVHILDKPIMAGEDFAFYQQHFPGTFFFLGSGSPDSESTYGWHHSKYNVDERCFKTGMALMASLVLS